jgi:hypothetical protein
MHLKSSLLALVGLVGFGLAGNGVAHAQAEAAPPPPPQEMPAPAPDQMPMQSPPMQGAAQGPAQAAAPEQGPSQQDYPIPPNVQGAAVPVQGGGYCFGGPHPAPGGGWEASPNPHVHDYAPFDLRLFAYHNGCYYFIGDPRDFGYTGQSYNYYGAHPIADEYGGGWCFMVGPHYHWWRPWSPSFTVVGPWYYWNGPYDPYFWAYWPFYSFYYRSYYPSFYAGGRYFRGGFRAAPPIARVPASVGAGWRGGAGYRGAPAGAWRGGAGAPAYGGGAWRGGAGAPAYGGGGWRGAAPVPYSAPRVGGGGFRGGGGFHSGGGFHGGGGFHIHGR